MQDEKTLYAGFRPRPTTRRDFMIRALASGVTIAAATTLWERAALAAPVKGGHLRLGLAGGSTTDSLDPAPWSDTFMVMIGFSVRGNLLELMPDGTLRGEAAESWGASDGARTWTFKLRKGVEFSNGKTLTAEDVIASLNHHRGDQSKSGAKGLFSAVTDIRADGNETVGKMKVLSVLESLPGLGKVKARRLMETVGISESRRLQGLGSNQRESLLRETAR